MKIAFYLAAKGAAQDKAIAAYTHGPYSHVEFVIDETFAPSIPPALIHPHDAGGSLCYTSSPQKPRDGCGFERINLSDGKWRTFDLPSLLNWQPAVTLALADNGRLYDWRGIVGVVIKGQDNKQERFCSEECVLLLQSVGMLLGLKAATVSPNYLAQVLGAL
jgi:hypothetical protein